MEQKLQSLVVREAELKTESLLLHQPGKPPECRRSQADRPFLAYVGLELQGAGHVLANLDFFEIRDPGNLHYLNAQPFREWHHNRVLPRYCQDVDTSAAYRPDGSSEAAPIIELQVNWFYSNCEASNNHAAPRRNAFVRSTRVLRVEAKGGRIKGCHDSDCFMIQQL